MPNGFNFIFNNQLPMAQEPTMKFNSTSKGFSLGWDAPDVRAPHSNTRTEPSEYACSTRGAKFLERKPLDVSSKVGSSNVSVSAVLTPKVTRNDKEKSTFYFGDLPPAFEGKSFRKRTEQEVEEEGRRHDAAQQLKQRSRKDEIERLHNQNISKIQEGTRSRQGFRF